MSTVAQVQDQKQSVAFKQLLIATDFSEVSQRALAFAVAIARRYGSALSVVHAIPPERREPVPLEPLPRELNRRLLEAEQQMMRVGEDARMNDLNYHLVLESGPVWDVLAFQKGLAEERLRLRPSEKRGSTGSNIRHRARSARVRVYRVHRLLLLQPLRRPSGKVCLHANTGMWSSRRDSHTSRP
jgi:hypothetical protein